MTLLSCYFAKSRHELTDHSDILPEATIWLNTCRWRPILFLHTSYSLLFWTSICSSKYY